MQLNASRIKVLQAQDDVVNSMREAASKELLNVGQEHHEYKKLLKDLIVQVGDSMLYLMWLNVLSDIVLAVVCMILSNNTIMGEDYSKNNTC